MRGVGWERRDMHTELYTEQFKKKVTLSHVYNEVTSEPTITRYTTMLGKLSKFVCNSAYRTPFAVESTFCNTVSPGGGPKHFRDNYKQTLRVFPTIYARHSWVRFRTGCPKWTRTGRLAFIPVYMLREGLKIGLYWKLKLY
jgi:hypothetical protein